MEEATTSQPATKGYKLRHGHNHFDAVNGVMITAGTVVQLTDAQAKAFKDKFVPESAELPPPPAAVETDGDEEDDDAGEEDDEEDGDEDAPESRADDGEVNNIEAILAEKERRKAERKAAKKLKKQNKK